MPIETLPTDGLPGQLPPIFARRIEDTRQDVMRELQPTIDTIARIHDWVSNALGQHRITRPELIVNRTHLTLAELMRPEGDKRIALAAQYEHIKQVLGTTLSLKRTLLEAGVPLRTYAYQLGTGFPLPAENGSLEKVLTIPYGAKPLEYTGVPGVAGHGDDAGLHIYVITGESGQQATLIALKGRLHGYEKVHSIFPHLSLALIPRILKGIGTEAILTTMATGFDGVGSVEEGPFQIGDYGIILVNSDLSGMSSTTDPGVGDQTLVGPIFGGPFRPGVLRKSHQGLAQEFYHQATQASAQGNYSSGGRSPKVWPTVQIDAPCTPHFENAFDWAHVRETVREMQRYNTLPPDLLRIFPSHVIAIAHGMSVAPELAAYFQTLPSISGGVASVFNRELPYLAVVAATDLVDPRAGGQSYTLSHQEVLAAGAKSADFIAPVITKYFIRLVDNPPLSQ